MKFSTAATLAVLATAIAAVNVDAYPDYNARSPNGGIVGEALGHPGGDYKAYTKFSDDEKATGLDWAKLCVIDSDEDGQSNGEELGDPCCVWKVGDTPLTSVGISNPGDGSDLGTVGKCPDTAAAPPPPPPPPVDPTVLRYGAAASPANKFVDPAQTGGKTCQGDSAAQCVIPGYRVGWKDLSMLGCPGTDCVNENCCTNGPYPRCSSIPRSMCPSGQNVLKPSKACTTDPCLPSACCEVIPAVTDTYTTFNCADCVAEYPSASWCNLAVPVGNKRAGCHSNLSPCELDASMRVIALRDVKVCLSIDGSEPASTEAEIKAAKEEEERKKNANNEPAYEDPKDIAKKSGFGDVRSSSASTLFVSLASIVLPAVAMLL